MIESKRLLFRPINVDDTDMVLKWRNSEAIQNNFIYRKEVTREDHLNWLKTRVETGEVIQFIIVEKDKGRPIGSVYVRDINKEQMTGEYGIFIGEEDARSRGYGTETAKAIVKYFFEDLKFNKLTLRVLAKNKSAARSYECAGFKADETKSITINDMDTDIIFMSVCNKVSIHG